MERKIVLNLFYMGISTAIAGIIISTIVYYSYFKREMEENLAHEGHIVSQFYDKMTSPDELQRFEDEGFRITLIDKCGTVLYESDADVISMQNHLDRPEIAEALANGTGNDTRYSDTIGSEDYYYAIRLDDGNILRVSIQADSIVVLFQRSLFIIIGVIIAIIAVSLFFSVKLTDHLIAPIKRIPEILEKNKSPQKGEIYEELIPLIEEIKKVKNSQEQMRQEFTANVSHELKTPLTSISGYAELIETGIAQGEDSVKFAEKIRSESARMLVLIGDIIRLSELDASPEKPHEDLVDLVSVAEECKERLAQQAEQRGIRITITGQSEPIVGSLSEITVLVYNLIDNAIKYNRENGNIDVEISDKTVVVSDTGIGIPKDSIPRIFERFYRTDKSRSRAKGGTGLGLSIVKHIADRHNARIDVESMLNVGTNIIVKF